MRRCTLEAVSTPENRVIVSKLCSVLTISTAGGNVDPLPHGLFTSYFGGGNGVISFLCERFLFPLSSFVSTSCQNTYGTWRWEPFLSTMLWTQITAKLALEPYPIRQVMAEKVG